jgi:hypothetical protein
LQNLGEEFALLRALEFIPGETNSVGPCTSFLDDFQIFLAFMERQCPKLFSGRRRRRDASEWLALFNPPARDLARLQQRVAQLLEQQMWVLLERPAMYDLWASAEHLLRTEKSSSQKQTKRKAHTAENAQVRPRAGPKLDKDTLSDTAILQEHLADLASTQVPNPPSVSPGAATEVCEAGETMHDTTEADASTSASTATADHALERQSSNSASEGAHSEGRDVSVERRRKKAPLLVTVWRKAAAEAKTGQQASRRTEAALWRQFGQATRGLLERKGRDDPLELLRDQLCVACQARGRSAGRACLCLGDARQQLSAASDSHVSSKTQDTTADLDLNEPRWSAATTVGQPLWEEVPILKEPGDEAAQLLKECFQFANDPFCGDAGSPEKPTIFRPWRPINPAVGASTLWRRRENVRWRLFWAARQHRTIEEEPEELEHQPNSPTIEEVNRGRGMEAGWPQTPSTLEEQDLRSHSEMSEAAECYFRSSFASSTPLPGAPPGLQPFCGDLTAPLLQSSLAVQRSMPSAAIHQGLTGDEELHRLSQRNAELERRAQLDEVVTRQLLARNMELERRVAELEHKMNLREAD